MRVVLGCLARRLEHCVCSFWNDKTHCGNDSVLKPCQTRKLRPRYSLVIVGVHGVPVGSPRTIVFFFLSAEPTVFRVIADVQDDQLGHPMLSMETRWGGTLRMICLRVKQLCPAFPAFGIVVCRSRRERDIPSF